MTLPPTKFREDAYTATLNKKLRLGFLRYKRGDKCFDGLESLPVSQATSLMCSNVRENLRAAGHTLVPFELTLEEVDEMSSIYLAFTKIAVIPTL